MSTRPQFKKELAVLATDTATTDWINVKEWQFQHENKRTVIVEMAAADTVNIEVCHALTTDADFANHPVHTIALTGNTSELVVLEGPIGAIRVTKSGVTAAATVSMII